MEFVGEAEDRGAGMLRCTGHGGESRVAGRCVFIYARARVRHSRVRCVCWRPDRMGESCNWW
jgi:hypothetical protein